MTATMMGRLGARSGRVRGLSLLFDLLVLGGCEAGQQVAAAPLAVAAGNAGEAAFKPEGLPMWMTAGERRFAITLTDNPAAGAFAAQLPLASTIAFHLYPNVNLFFNTGIFTAVRNYPDATRVGQSMTRVTFFKPDHTLPEAIKSADMSQLSGENLYTPDVSKPMAFSLSAMMELFNSSVEREDYIAGAHIQVSANSAMLDKVMFGSNEPGLHHFHKNYRNALGLPPLEPHRAA